MKKFYLGITGIAVLGLVYAFTINSNKEDNSLKKDNYYCVSIYCNGKTIKETIKAFGSYEAKDIAKARYPNCKIGSVWNGPCK